MRFLGRKWEKKNEGDGNGNRMSYFALGASFAQIDKQENATTVMGREVDLSTVLLTMRL